MLCLTLLSATLVLPSLCGTGKCSTQHAAIARAAPRCRVVSVAWFLNFDRSKEVSEAAGLEGFQDSGAAAKEGLQEAGAAGKEGLQDAGAAGKEGLKDVAVGLGVGLCMAGWFNAASNLLSAVIITPISVGSLPRVLRWAAVGGVGVMVASPAMMLFWVWQNAMVLLRRRAQERKTAPHTTDPPEVAHQQSPPPLPKATLRPSQHPQHPRPVQHLRTTSLPFSSCIGPTTGRQSPVSPGAACC